MIFDITEFRSKAYGGFQKVEHFRLRMPYPPLLLYTYGGTQTAVQGLEFFANSIDHPGVAMATRDVVRYGYGVSEKKPVYTQFQPIMATFYADANELNLTFFQAWFNAIFNYDFSQGINPPIVQDNIQKNTGIPYRLPANANAYEVSYKDDYAVNAWIETFDNGENLVTTTFMREMFPIHIPEIKRDWSLTNMIMEITVIFAYSDWFVTEPSNIEYDNAIPSPPVLAPTTGPTTGSIGQVGGPFSSGTF